MKQIICIAVIVLLMGCQPTKDSKEKSAFTFASWTHSGKSFNKEKWIARLNGYHELGISEILIGGNPKIIEKIVPIATSKNISVHAWMWTLNRPNDSIANQHPDWYAVNRLGENSLEKRAYVDYYQWLSPFHPAARAYIKDNVKQLLKIKGLASIHLDYVRYPDVILGADLQPKYGIVQNKELPEYDYGYHPIAREGFKEIFDVDPMDFSHPELSTEWRQYRLNAVTSLVNEIADLVHRNNQKITAAVFPFPEMSRQMVRQAWNDWNLDTAYPMLYQNFYRQNISWIGFAAQQGVKDVDYPIVAGLYSPGLKEPNDLERAIRLAKDAGAKGIAIFTADNLSDRQKDVFLKLKSEFGL
ncbi:MAG: family 10 glycosylhydrolase [Flavobacteriaceae bacterium]